MSAPADRRATAVLLTAMLTVLAFTAPAEVRAAGGPSPTPPVPAVSQYIEAVPTSAGAVATGAKGSRGLPKKLGQRIDNLAGGTAPALRAIVTSAAYGAPQQKLVTPRPQARLHGRSSTPHRTTGARTTVHPSAPVSASALSAAEATVTSTGASILTVLIAAMAGIAFAGAAAVAIDRHRGRGSGS